jgi:hypothetical protein
MPFRLSLTDWEDGIELAAWGEQSYVVRVHAGDSIEDVAGLIRLLIEECDLPLSIGEIMVCAAMPFCEFERNIVRVTK